MSNDDNIPRVHAPEISPADVPTVPRGGGQPITDDAAIQHDNDVPEGQLTVTHTETARAVEAGQSPYPHAGMGDSGLAPDRPNRSTLDDSVGEGVVDDRY